MTGMTLYPNTHTVRHGSFDWTTLDVDVVLGGLQIGQDVTLWLGLQGTTGEVEFDLSTLRIEPGKIFFPRENEDYRCEYSKHCSPIFNVHQSSLSTNRQCKFALVAMLIGGQ